MAGVGLAALQVRSGVVLGAALPAAFAWQGSDVRSGIVLGAALPVAFAWQAWGLLLCKYGLASFWAPLCRWLLRGRRGACCVARGLMYALASFWVAFAWQVWGIVTDWRQSG